MGPDEVALAAIALCATVVGGLIWTLKYFASQLSRDLKEHTKAAMEMAQAGKEQKKASNEVLIFMKNLNGKLANATIQTIQEQHIGTQILDSNLKKGEI